MVSIDQARAGECKLLDHGLKRTKTFAWVASQWRQHCFLSIRSSAIACSCSLSPRHHAKRWKNPLSWKQHKAKLKQYVSVKFTSTGHNALPIQKSAECATTTFSVFCLCPPFIDDLLQTCPLKITNILAVFAWTVATSNSIMYYSCNIVFVTNRCK